MEGERGRKVFIGVAWPYANGSLHLGHIAGSLLPPDIFRRYHRLRGDEVLMVSGSDEHGTPITVTAERRGTTPAAVADQYHREHVESLRRFGIELDLFFRTSDPRHKEVVWDLFNRLMEKGLIYKKELEALRCPRCARFLPDRYVEGTCPRCGAHDARGDQCDGCGKTLDPAELKAPRCKLCGTTPAPETTEHFFFRLSAFQQELEQWVGGKGHWRPTVLNFTRNWLREGLRDRAITRDLPWGVEIPLPGYESKRIYVWFEAVMGYLSASMEWARQNGRPEGWKDFWTDPAVRHYYFLGKDNIPFHTIIWPSILLGRGGLNLPYDVPANEFLSFAGVKFSKSRGVGIELPPYLDRWAPDPMRYYLTINAPELHDTDFTWEEFVRKNNDELVGTLGNFANRVLTFTWKHFAMVPDHAEDDELDREVMRLVHSAYDAVERHLEACQFKLALKEAMNLAQHGNKLIDTLAPWKLIQQDKTKCGGALYACLRLTKALCMLIFPFLPFSSRKLWRMLGEEREIDLCRWEDGRGPLPVDRRLPKPEPLFEKLDIDKVAGLEPTEEAPSAAPARAPQGAPAPVKGAPAEAAQRPSSTAVPPAPAAVPSDSSSAPQVPSAAASPAPSAPAARPVDPAESGRWFDKAHIVVGKVLEVAMHPKADKLYITRVTIGSEERQIVAGMRQHYTEQELAGKTVAVITNLEPAKLRGAESAGMILAFDEEGGKRIALVVPSGAASPGERIVALGRPQSPPAKSISFKEFNRIEMRCHTVASMKGDSALVIAGGSALDVWAGAGLSAGMKVAVLTADAWAILATASGVPLTADREIADGARVR